MAQTKIVVDTNAYFRLAQNIHPLLCRPFGQEQYTLYAHADLNTELKNVIRVRGKLDWVSQPKYIAARKRSLTLSKINKKEINKNYDYMWGHALEEFHQPEGKGPSQVDTLILATALALDIYVVTDDQDMLKLAQDFEVKQMTSLELMKLMFDQKHIDLEKIKQVVEQWQFDKETPHKNWETEYKNLFGHSPPRYS